MPVKQKDAKAMDVATYAQRMEAAAMLYMHGTSRKAAKNCSFPVAASTIRTWKNQNSDFQDNYKQLIADNTAEAQTKYREIIQKGLEALVDRIDHGNVKAVSTGEYLKDEDGEFVLNERGLKVMGTSEYREPMTSKDLTYTTGIMIDKYNVSLGQATSIRKTVTDEKALMEGFTKIYDQYGTKGIIDAVANDVTPKKLS